MKERERWRENEKRERERENERKENGPREKKYQSFFVCHVIMVRS